MLFCATPDRSARLAVLGVLSADSRILLRHAARRTYVLAAAKSGILPRFVLRGIGAAPSTVREANLHHDIIFVQANANASRMSGPLESLLLWLRCAISAWPAATLVGKADDDTWMNLPSVASHLRASLEALQASSSQSQLSGPSALYWGQMETYHWDFHTQRPAETFGVRFQNKACTRRTSLGIPAQATRTSTDLLLPVPRGQIWRDTNSTGLFVGPFHFGLPLLIKPQPFTHYSSRTQQELRHLRSGSEGSALLPLALFGDAAGHRPWRGTGGKRNHCVRSQRTRRACPI